MEKAKVDKLIVKLIDNTISGQESEQLATWLEDAENLSYFNDFIKVNQLIAANQKFDYKVPLQRFKAQYQIKKGYKKRIWYAAASVVVLVSLGIFMAKNSFNNAPLVPTIVNNTIESGTNKATLLLEDGQEIVFEKNNPLQTQNAISNGKEIVYHKNDKLTELVYNTLTIPRGGQFFLKLSDGTQVWLNSETQLKYPVNFIKGASRKVELIYGEAYFDVSPSTQHEGSNFKVVNQEQEITVLGTEFNMKAYNGENIYTTLVEGKVEVANQTTSQVLSPGEQSNNNIQTKEINLLKVDVYDQISWKEGIFSFKRKTLKEIMTILSRWYDMEVVFENSALEQRGFNGSLGKGQNIEDILEAIKEFGTIENYEINNKQVTLK